MFHGWKANWGFEIVTQPMDIRKLTSLHLQSMAYGGNAPISLPKDSESLLENVPICLATFNFFIPSRSRHRRGRLADVPHERPGPVRELRLPGGLRVHRSLTRRNRRVVRLVPR
jgi:hypothetical protein